MKKNVFVKTGAAALAFCTLFTLNAGAYSSIENFSLFNEYETGIFEDVDESKWYGVYEQGVIQKVYELGLMQGRGECFAPEASVTIAEAVAMAARVSKIYYEAGSEFEAGNPWYRPYIDYAVRNGIIGPETFSDYSRSITRGEMAYIFANSLPESEFKTINPTESIPDVDENTKFRESIFMLYNAGILTGSGADRAFCPDKTLTRAEAAAIISRIAVPDMRKGEVVSGEVGSGEESSQASVNEQPDLMQWLMQIADDDKFLDIVYSMFSKSDDEGTTDKDIQRKIAEMSVVFSHYAGAERLLTDEEILQAIPELLTDEQIEEIVGKIYERLYDADWSEEQRQAAISNILLAFSKEENDCSVSAGEPNASSNYISWDEFYNGEVTIYSEDELYNICYMAIANLAPGFEATLKGPIWYEFNKKLSSWFPYNLGGKFTYDGITSYLKAEFKEYPLLQQMDSLCFNYQGASKYASEEALYYDSIIKQILSEIISEDMSDVDKLKAMHDYMIRNYAYDVDLSYGAETYEFQCLLNNNTGVCQAYMELFYYLCSYSGIKCYTVTGKMKKSGIGHGWNAVELDGQIYFIDVTFDDPVPDTGDNVRYDYFMLSEDEISADRILDDYLNEQWHILSR